MINESIICNNYNDIYMCKCAYEEYLDNKIKNEESIISYLKPYVPVNESSYKNVRVITEGRFIDKIKVKLKDLMEFIKNMIGRFMEAITRIILNEQDYLTKYKNIILEKKPKKISFSYTGDYKTAIDRCMNTPVPVFNYDAHAEALKKDGYSPILSIIMKGKEFKPDDGKKPAEQFKEYFLAVDKGQTTGTFDDGKLNFKDMYNFCMNFKEIEDITKKDQNYLNQSTTAILNATNAKIKETNEKNTNQNPAPANTENKQTSNVSSNTTGEKQNTDTSDKTNNNTGSNESFKFANGKYITENENEKEDQPQTKDNLVINSDSISQMGSYSNNRAAISDEEKNSNANSAVNNNTSTDEMNQICNKWITVCRALIAAKCTIVQQIASSYMSIIRTHVQSYIGKSDNTKDNKPQDKETNYAKNKNQTK